MMVPLEGGDDAAAEGAVLVPVGGAHADERLAAPAHGRAGEIVQLPAGAGDVPGAGALRANLAVQVHGNAAVDGNHMVDLGDGLRVVDILQRAGNHAGVVPHPVIQRLGAQGDAEHPLVPEEALAAVGELARLVELEIRVGAQLRVHPQVLQVRLGNERAHHVGHGPDAQLNGGSVGEEGHNMARDGPVHLGGRRGGELGQRGVVALHDMVHLADVDDLVKAAPDPGEIFIDLQNHHLGLVQNALGHPGAH